MRKSYVVYDLKKKKIVKIYSALKRQRYDVFVLYYSDGTLVDVCNQKEYKVKAKFFPKCYLICGDVYNYRKYVGYWNLQDELVLIDNATGQQITLFRDIPTSTIYIVRIMDDLDQVMYQGENTRVYDIKTKRCIFEFEYEFYLDYRMQSFDGFHLYESSRFFGYSKKDKEWKEMGKWPYQAHKIHRYVENPFLMPAYTTHRVVNDNVLNFTHFDWSSGHLTSKVSTSRSQKSRI
ncbi:unnamed protein product [Bursaphelenchus okinawaensis]|uniref:Uncharacterized protein n=1 Tax=Bursaphelenchus okinawaensis TaxID=465554 RepID=A0A811KUS0_9BILA|nr:unnamed protein product [Bursaphelenchus okinawaensis]CAG9112445.1 unnamed protein product [Bursaphelenchus okinawaensis]